MEILKESQDDRILRKLRNSPRQAVWALQRQRKIGISKPSPIRSPETEQRGLHWRLLFVPPGVRDRIGRRPRIDHRILRFNSGWKSIWQEQQFLLCSVVILHDFRYRNRAKFYNLASIGPGD
ncbi:hypothetical protein GGD66_005818 [Bradyrhizobium sp. CIR48]|uniref:hypothetical protein n=1 Tax=Bradyrhizobium sp. CIR48 TaxID=2663840 RepID=UPI00178ED6EE|nr:hypothetical protein [Bradyrhizobium sp. CIR48]MBB4427236.1 hypothetical protein [Bradyrhizobium sp. CIR48]